MMAARVTGYSIIGIDPGAVAGIIVIRFHVRDVAGQGRTLVPTVMDARVVESTGMIHDPSTPAMEIVRVAVLLASMHEPAAIGLEIPKGPSMRKRMVSYGAQRETIGAIRGGLLSHGLETITVAPGGAKKALAGSGASSKDEMVEAFKKLAGWEKAWDTAKYRMEAKADAAGIALAAAKIWEKQREGVGA